MKWIAGQDLRQALNRERACRRREASLQVRVSQLTDYARRAHDVLADAGCECWPEDPDSQCLTCHGEAVLGEDDEEGSS